MNFNKSRKFLAGIALGAALFMPAQAAFAQTGPQDKVARPEQPQPPRGPGDITSQPEDPECNPILASCDLVDRPDQPDQPDPDQPADEVDEPVIANPTFTG